MAVHTPRTPTQDPTPGRWLERQRAAWGAEQAAANGTEARLSAARLILFAAAVAVWFFLADHVLVCVAVSGGLLTAFAWAVRRHNVWLRRRESLDRLLLVTEEARRRAGGAVVCLREATRPAEDPDVDAALPVSAHEGPIWQLTGQEADDLDLFAEPVGVFGLLNRTSTGPGARRLRDALERQLLDPDAIRTRQNAVGWLARNRGPRLRLLAAAAVLRLEDRRLANFLRALRAAEPCTVFGGKAALWLATAFSLAVTVFAFSLMAVGQLSLAAPALLLFIANAIAIMRSRARLAVALDPWRDTGWAARGLSVAVDEAAARLPEEGRLGELRSAFRRAAEGRGLGRIAGRVAWADSGGFVKALLNLTVYFDVHLARTLSRAAVRHREELCNATGALAELEMLLSLACFCDEQPVCAFPTIVEAPSPRLGIRGGCHPLLAPQRVVANDVDLGGATRLWIVTGSNMAGKSTLLRMTGVSAVLAQIGCGVTATAMEFTPLRLISDLRARDDLAQEESYFLAEVRHLRRLVNAPDGEAPVLGLIDEPFRGTNSDDQTAASVAVVRHLLAAEHLLCMLATHDRNLTELADGQRVRNYHFRENLGADGMVFDYRLHDGPARTRNALLVLEREGYPASLLDTARSWLREHVVDLHADETASLGDARRQEPDG